MATSRQHQEAHGIGQIEKQLNRQAEAAAQIQGGSETDREINEASMKKDSAVKEEADPEQK
ncbi:hypothetical protein ACE3NQ_21590 [Paenibacillus terreus]|uniref:Uncharacterized protein n=1 Tax=Paenibacillus terreus TaxID=1387834 RepID=A0ABV5BF90_9BACL